MNLEDQVRSQMTDLVQTEGLEESVAPDRQWMHDLVQGGRAGVRDLPEDIRLAWEIQNVNTEIRDIPNRRRPRDPWWTEEEEEEEEEGGDDAGSG
jgi:hypothetical protein